jgi:hypothetical protein
MSNRFKRLTRICPDHPGSALPHTEILNLMKNKLVVRPMVKLRRAMGFVRRNLPSRFKLSLVFKVNRDPSGPERVATDRGHARGFIHPEFDNREKALGLVVREKR